MNIKYFRLILFLFFVIFCFVFTIYYTRQEQNLYACDYVEQNLFYYDYGQLFFSNIQGFFKEFFTSISSLNRSPFINIFLIPFYFFFKESRLGYIIAIESIFMIPSILLVLYIVYKNIITDEQKKSKSFNLLLFSTVFLFPTIWLPVLSGIPDIFGMLLVLSSFVLYFKYRFNEKVSLKIILILALLLYLSFIARRWYSVVITTIIISILLENIISAFIEFSDKKLVVRKIAYTVFNLLKVVIIIALLSCIFQWDYVQNIFANELKERALYVMSVSQIPYLTYRSLGYFCILISTIGALFCIKNFVIRFALLNLFIYLFLFLVVMNNQLLWMNHYLFIAFCVLILFVSGISFIIDCTKNTFIKNLSICFFILFNCYNYLTFYCIDKVYYLDKFLPTNTYHPVVNENYDKVFSLLNYLESEFNKNNKILIVQYGLNKSLGYYQFRSIKPNSSFIKTNIHPELVFDSDINDITSNADFVIMLSNLGLFADEKYSSELISISNQFKNNQGIAKNYSLVKTITLTGEQPSIVKLYKKL